jgi:outer membrane murein-binding lipoprotein Lpp
MIPLIVASGTFLCVFIGALVGLWLGRNVPEHYRDSPSQEAIQLATGMLSVLAALVLGLLTSSIQSNFDTINTEVNDFAAQLAMLDQTLADMGPEAAAARQLLRRYTEVSIQENWPEESGLAQHGWAWPSMAPAARSSIPSRASSNLSAVSPTPCGGRGRRRTGF